MKDRKINYLVYVLMFIMLLFSIVNMSYFKFFNEFLWLIVIFLLIIFCFYLTLRLKFVQFRFLKIIKSLFVNNSNSGSNISSIEALSITIAGKIGVGSLSGVALAIYLGGPGVVFWMWISSILFSILTYCEVYLGVKFQEKHGDEYCGGPSYYIKNGLKNRGLAISYSVCIILAYIVGFLGVQSNTIVKSVCDLSGFSSIFVVSILCIITMFVIFGKTKRLVVITTKFVPIMTILYIILGGYIILMNINNFSIIIKNIFNDAFSIRSGIISVIVIGIQKGLFASESGIGVSAIASASTNDSPSKQGLLQLFGVHFTTLIICTITVFIVLNSNYSLINGDINGIEIMILAFYNNFGRLGSYFFGIITTLFAFSTIVSGYFFGESSLRYIKGNLSNIQLVIFKIFCLCLIFIGGIINSSIVWIIADIFVLFLTIINGYSIYKLHSNISFNT